MEPIAAYGMAITLGAPPPAAMPAEVAPRAGAVSPWATGFSDLVAVNRWQSAAVGTLVVIGLALYTNALLDES